MNYSGAPFYAATFASATFTGSANFVGATFSGGASFYQATFSGIAGFSGATFSGEANFSSATFTGYANYSGATFEANVEFRSLKTFPHTVLDFRPRLIKEPERVFSTQRTCVQAGSST